MPKQIISEGVVWCRDVKMSSPLCRNSVKGINDSPELESDGDTWVPSVPPGIPVLAERKAMKFEVF